jgi:hypothetical protein
MVVVVTASTIRGLGVGLLRALGRDMLIRSSLFMFVLGASACAARAPLSTLDVNAPQARYACDNDEIVRDGRAVFSSRESQHIHRGWTDGEGEHFVEWPRRTTTMEALEYVIPTDELQDAKVRVYDTSGGSSRADWRMKHQSLCTASGGYTAAFAHYASGESMEQISRDLSLGSTDKARMMIEKALHDAQARYLAGR